MFSENTRQWSAVLFSDVNKEACFAACLHTAEFGGAFMRATTHRLVLTEDSNDCFVAPSERPNVQPYRVSNNSRFLI